MPHGRRTERCVARPTFTDVAEYLGARTLAAGLRAMGLDQGSAALGATFAALMPHTRRHARALEHLALALPERSAAERERIACAMWRHLGRVAAEALMIDRLVADPTRMALPADFAALADRAKEGAILATLHLGNWELAGPLAGRAGLTIAGVYQALHNPLSDRYFRSEREKIFTAGYYRKGPTLGRTMIRLARRGVSIGMAGDLREKRGVGVRFFGEPAFATPIPAMLAILSGRPLLAGAVVRTEGVRFHALLEEVPVRSTGDRDADIAATTQDLHDVFERWIRARPEQWMWTHRKWARSAKRELLVRPAPAAADA